MRGLAVWTYYAWFDHHVSDSSGRGGVSSDRLASSNKA